MNYILKFAASVLVLFSACTFSEPKDYQRVWMDEPLSLHDMMMIEADKKLHDKLLKHLKNKQMIFGYGEIKQYQQEWDWIKQTDPKWYFSDFVTSLYLADSEAIYDWNTGKYIFSSEFVWEFSPELILYSLNKNHDQGLLANTQRNIANACDIFLKKIDYLLFLPPAHKGYKNKKLDEFFPDYYKFIKADIVYRATIYVNTRNDKTHLICSKPYVDMPEVQYDFKGDWHKLDEYQKMIREIDKKRGWHKEIK